MPIVYKREKPESSQKPSVPVWIYALPCIGVLAVIGLITQPSGKMKELQAWQAAKECVTDALKSPSSASFPWHEAQFVNELSPNRYDVRAWVDAENAFGAKLRQNWKTVMSQDGTDWHCEGVTFYEGL